MWIKLGEELRQIPDDVWEKWLSNSYIKPNAKLDKSKIKKALGYTWYLDDEKK